MIISPYSKVIVRLSCRKMNNDYVPLKHRLAFFFFLPPFLTGLSML